MKPSILTMSALKDSDRYTLVPHVPMLDIHEHINDEKPEVDEDLLELIARNTNSRIENLAIPAGNAGHTCEPGECSEDEQPETIAYVVNWEVDEFNGRPCLYADVYYRNDKLKLAKKLPYRSVERYISDRPDRNFIDAVSFQKSAPERDLGVLEFYHRSMEPGDAIVRYGRDMPAIKIPATCGAADGECNFGCGCTPGDTPKANPKAKTEAPAKVNSEAKPKSKNKGQFKKGNDHHKKRHDRKLNEGVQVNMGHLKESILELLKKSKTGTIKARYSLDDPLKTNTASTAGPSAKVGQDVRSAFGHLGTVIGPGTNPAPKPDARFTPGAQPPPATVGPAAGGPAKAKTAPHKQPPDNPTQAMPGQQQQQPAPTGQPAAPQQPAARSGELPATAKVSPKVYDQAQRDAALGKTPAPQPRPAAPIDPAKVAGVKRQAATTAPGANFAVPKNAPIPLSGDNRTYPLGKGAPVPVSQGRTGAIPLDGDSIDPYDVAPSRTATPKRRQVDVAARAAKPVDPSKVAGSKGQSRASAGANPKLPRNAPVPMGGGKQGYPLAPGNIGGFSPGTGGAIPLAGSEAKVDPYDLTDEGSRIVPPKPLGPLEQGAVSPRLGRTFKAATDRKTPSPAKPLQAKVPTPSADDIRNFGKRVVKTKGGQSVPVQVGVKNPGDPSGPVVKANDISGKSYRFTNKEDQVNGYDGTYKARHDNGSGEVFLKADDGSHGVRMPASQFESVFGEKLNTVVRPGGGSRFDVPVRAQEHEVNQAKAAARAGNTDAINAFLERHKDTPIAGQFKKWMMSSANKPVMPKPTIGSKEATRGVSALPKAVGSAKSKKARIEAGDKLTTSSGGTYSVMGHTPASEKERFVHLKDEKTGKEIKVPRGRFHAALQRGKITLPDEAFARTAPKPQAEPRGGNNWRFGDGEPARGTKEYLGDRMANSHPDKAKQDFSDYQNDRLDLESFSNQNATTGPRDKAWRSKTYQNPDPQAKPADAVKPGVNPYANLDTPNTPGWATRQPAGEAGATPREPKKARPKTQAERAERTARRKEAWTELHRTAIQNNGGYGLTPSQHEELAGSFNQLFNDAEAKRLAANPTPQPAQGQPYGSLPPADDRHKLSMGNFWRDHWRSVLGGGMTGLSGRMSPLLFDKAHNPPNLPDPGPVTAYNAVGYRHANSRVSGGGNYNPNVNHAADVADAAYHGHPRHGYVGNGATQGIPNSPTQPAPGPGVQQPAQPQPQPQPQADPRVRPSKVVTPEEMAAEPAKIQNSGDPMFSQVVTSLAHQKRKMTADEYRRMDAHWPEIKEALGDAAEQRKAAGQETTHKETADDFARIVASLPQQAPVTPQEPAQAAPGAQAGQQPSVHPVAAKQLQAAQAMASGGKAGSEFAKDTVVQAAALAARMGRRQPTAEDIDRLHETWKDMFRDNKKEPTYQELAHAYLHGQQQAPQAQPGVEPEQQPGQPEQTQADTETQGASQAQPQYRHFGDDHADELRRAGMPEYGIKALDDLASMVAEDKGDPRIQDLLFDMKSAPLPKKGQVKLHGVPDPKYKALDRGYVDALIKSGLSNMALSSLNSMVINEKRGLLPRNTWLILKALGDSGLQTPFNMPRVKPEPQAKPVLAPQPDPYPTHPGPIKFDQSDQVAKMKRTILKALRAASAQNARPSRARRVRSA